MMSIWQHFDYIFQTSKKSHLKIAAKRYLNGTFQYLFPGFKKYKNIKLIGKNHEEIKGINFTTTIVRELKGTLKFSTHYSYNGTQRDFQDVSRHMNSDSRTHVIIIRGSFVCLVLLLRSFYSRRF